MNIAFSSCPNDTFVFHAWVHGLIPEAPQLNVTYADINMTNRLAASGSGPDLLKVSYALLPWVLSEYALLPCGGALGRGCGPLLLVKHRSTDPGVLSGGRVAVPDERSTAYLLFRLWTAENVPGGVRDVVVMPFHEIMPAVRSGHIDAGLVIHEARFIYPNYGLTLLADMGQWWEANTGRPVPLGAIIARRHMDFASLTRSIRASVDYAWAHPNVAWDYILHHAQAMNPEVAQAHINLYVNEFTRNIGEEGYNAITTLLGRAVEQEMVPPFNLAALRLE